jgi:SNF2 family DNA or RNA helicase
VPRPDATEIASKMLQPSVRFTRDECFDLTETVVQTRKVVLTAEQETHYKSMMKTLIADLAGGQITAANDAVKALKLIQICCGVAYGEDGKNIHLDCSPRIRAVREVIEEIGDKVIIFVPLTGTLRMLEEELGKDYTVGVVNGEVSSSKRDVIFHNFQNTNVRYRKHHWPIIAQNHPHKLDWLRQLPQLDLEG